ncbi:MAG: iron-sulfur cluster-binding protein [Verrucomicrobiae bacterium]|nr:iron-sulfur cluster-binding protein [Verrucomicrobiae bacterium]
MNPQPIDRYAETLARETRDSVSASAAITTEKRVDILARDFPDPDGLRRLAGQIKQHTLEHLDDYLAKAVRALRDNGVVVHFAADAEEARKLILGLLSERGVRRVVKSKSMATEEIHLNDHLAAHGIDCVETDLGEFIVQIDGDTPSHIVRPIIHKNRREIARSFEAHGLGDYDDDPETITRRARIHLRSKYMESDAGITGGNFISAESGRVVLVTNEGNARFSMAPNRLHLALIGIEKIVPRDRDLAVFLNLLARSATAQQLTVYTQFINGPRASTQPSGPEEMHVVLLDNGRSRVLATDCREILRCIRCGACQNVCPVYRQASGHAYRAVYGGPVGAVLSPLLAGERFSDLADLPKASTLCGACREVCPVDIPIPDLLLRLRARAKEEGVRTPASIPMAPFATLATSPALWRTAMTASRAMNHLPTAALPVKPLREWLKLRTLPEWRGGEFRKWMKKRKQS